MSSWAVAHPAPAWALDSAKPGIPTSPVVIINDSAVVEVQDGEDPIAPEAFAVDGTKILLADQAHGTIRTYTSSQLTQVSDLGGVEPSDLQWSGGSLMVLSGDSTIYHLNVSGTVATQASSSLSLGSRTRVVSVPQGSVPDDPTATSLSYEIDARQLDMSTSTTGARYTDDLMVSTENGSVINPAFVPIGARETIVSTTTGYDIVSGTNAVLRRMTLPYEPQGIEILGRSAGYIYYLATDGHNDIDGNLVFNRYVFKFSLANNAPVATYTLRSTLTRPNRDIVLAADEVYQMTISNTSASVVKLNPDLAGTPVGSVYAGPGDGSSTNSVPRVSFFNVMVGSIEMSQYSWTYTKATNGNKSQLGSKASKVRQPRYLAAVTASTKKVKGVPYNWGGIAVPSHADTSVTTNFTSAAADGKYTGNTSSANGTIVSGTTGIDCSGLVSAVFSLPRKYGSGELIGSTYFKKVSTTNPQPGDILQHPGHVAIYLGKSGAKWVIAEATTTKSSSDRVMAWDRPKTDFGGWQVGRYRNLAGND
jgi:hypothetical protein